LFPAIILSFIHIIVVLFSGVFPDKTKPYSSAFLPAVKIQEFNNSELYEASGLVASVNNPDHFWLINDSGNAAKVYLLDKQCNIARSYSLEGADNKDWEDIALYFDRSSKKNKILIGDIGDNRALRKSINLIEFDEPSLSTGIDTIISNYKNYAFKYDDHPRDAETLVVDPLTSTPYIISKREEQVGVYKSKSSLVSGDTMVLSLVTQLPFHNVTAGDVSLSGMEILLKSYNAIFYWKRKKEESFIDAITREHELLNYIPEPQGESLCWDLKESGFYTLSEKSWASQQIFYFHEKKPN